MHKHAVLIVALAAFVLPDAAAAVQRCPPPGTTAVNTTSLAGATLVVYTGSQYTPDPDLAAAGVCLDAENQVVVEGTRFDGGTIEAGADIDDGVIPDPIGYVDTTPDNFPPQLVDGGQWKTGLVPGAYVIADGEDDNSGGLGTYLGASNWETQTPDPDCDGVDDGSGTNSGGCVTVRDLSGTTPVLALPIPLIVGGDTSGPYDGARRDGWSVP
jgi:hypothetical protein